MRIKCVVDSSSLISLAKADLDDYLELSGWRFVTIQAVFNEVVDLGLQKGFLDALKSKKLFDAGVVDVVAINKNNLSTDLQVVALAQDLQACLLVNDVKLGRIALSKGLIVFGSADLCFFLKEKKSISKTDFVISVNRLVAKNRLAKEVAEKYLKDEVP